MKTAGLRGAALLAALGCGALALPVAAIADAIVQDHAGDVQSATEPATLAPVAPRQRIASGATVRVGSGGRATLRFPDGLVLALEQDTTLKIIEYRYRDAALAASEDRARFQLQRGAVRVVTGTMAERSESAFQLAGPQASLTTRGRADLIVVLYNPMYLSVADGIVVMANNAGKLALPAGSTVTVASADAIAVTTQAGALPSAAASRVTSLQVAAGTPGGQAIGAATAGSATGVAAALPVVGVAAAVAGIAAAADKDDGATATTHH